MNAEPPLIELEGIGRRYRGKRGAPVIALRDVSLRLHAGEFVCITGPSGSGKTTLMNILGCLDQPNAGIYLFLGREVQQLSPDGLAWLRRKAFGFVFQNYNLLGSATARENVEMPGSYAGLALAPRRTRALKLLSGLGLAKRTGHRPAALSGGEQQRVSIARALMNGGRVILADEPTGALDSVNGEQVLGLLEELATRGHTIVLVTHNPEIAARAGRRIELRDGRVVLDTGLSREQRNIPLADETPGERQPVMGIATRLLQALRSGLTSLRANLLGTRKMRAMLSVFSILLGVWAVVTMLSIAEGVFRDTLEQVGRLGADLIEVAPDWSEGEPSVALTIEDAQAIAQSIGNVRRVVPNLSQRLTIRYGSENLQSNVESYAAFIPGSGIDGDAPAVERGRFLSPRNNENRDQVAVIGWGVADNLFEAGEDPLGTHVMIGDWPFRVVGVLAGREAFADAPDWLTDHEGRRTIIPYDTGAALLHGNRNPSSLNVFMQDPLQVDATDRAIRELLIGRHGNEGFRIAFMGARIEQVGEMRTMLWLGLGSIGGIALLAGGMGVMAIMLMAVTERTREIGIRMAVGARRRDITQQFVIEAIALASLGGLLGLCASMATSPLVQSFELPVAFSPWIVIAALVCAVGTGLVFGIVPARRAARLDPVTALATRG
ncbi:MAG: ATP-binding cassette domain-containing protein [Gammaproteobacteria bacterium]|nr:ATP-binding cassette domain-containing protein [Gammaproteobacteria bacterium]